MVFLTIDSYDKKYKNPRAFYDYISTLPHGELYEGVDVTKLGITNGIFYWRIGKRKEKPPIDSKIIMFYENKDDIKELVILTIGYVLQYRYRKNLIHLSAIRKGIKHTGSDMLKFCDIFMNYVGTKIVILTDLSRKDVINEDNQETSIDYFFHNIFLTGKTWYQNFGFQPCFELGKLPEEELKKYIETGLEKLRNTKMYEIYDNIVNVIKFIFQILISGPTETEEVVLHQNIINKQYIQKILVAFTHLVSMKIYLHNYLDEDDFKNKTLYEYYSNMWENFNELHYKNAFVGFYDSFIEIGGDYSWYLFSCNKFSFWETKTNNEIRIKIYDYIKNLAFFPRLHYKIYDKNLTFRIFYQKQVDK